MYITQLLHLLMAFKVVDGGGASKEWEGGGGDLSHTTNPVQLTQLRPFLRENGKVQVESGEWGVKCGKWKVFLITESESKIKYSISFAFLNISWLDSAGFSFCISVGALFNFQTLPALLIHHEYLILIVV